MRNKGLLRRGKDEEVGTSKREVVEKGRREKVGSGNGRGWRGGSLL